MIDISMLTAQQQMRPMTPAEFQKYMMDIRPAEPTTAQILAMMNYRPPVEVPAGWAEWYAHADEQESFGRGRSAVQIRPSRLCET